MATTTPLTATSPIPTTFSLKTQDMVSMVDLITQINTNSAALAANTSINVDVVKNLVNQDFENLQSWLDENFAKSQQQNGKLVPTGMNTSVQLILNLANVASTPITFSATVGTTTYTPQTTAIVR